MHIIALKRLKEFWEKHADIEEPLKAWHHHVAHAQWNSPTDIKSDYGNASFLANDRVVFDIKGGNYRLIVKLQYESQTVYIRFIGTHQEYDRLRDASVV